MVTVLPDTLHAKANFRHDAAPLDFLKRFPVYINHAAQSCIVLTEHAASFLSLDHDRGFEQYDLLKSN